MPRDQRLYMTFPIDFPDHPKVKPLSLAAKWAFVEMNAYSRRMGLDGVIPANVATTTWSKKVLAELVGSHAERPLVCSTDDTFVIRDYAEHQLTVDDIETLREKRAEAGSRGGKAKASNQQTASKPLASAIANAKQKASKPLAESESESEIPDDVTKYSGSTHLSSAPVIDFDATNLARSVGIDDLVSMRQLLSKTVGAEITYKGAIRLADAIVSRAARHVTKVDAYVATACRKSPAEVQQAFFDLDIEVAS